MGALRHLVVVVPGIGGSVLADAAGRTWWDLRLGDFARAVTDPWNLALDRELRPIALVDDLTVVPPWLVVPGYGGLSNHLRKHLGGDLRFADYVSGEGLPRDVDVLRVPYDFRRSVADSADVLGRAVTTAVGYTGRQVLVVAHSLGGLVARYWIGAGGGWRHCRSLITLGTPYRGAPLALDWLVNGARLGPFRSASTTRVLRDWPAMYELLPQYAAVLSSQGVAVEVAALPAGVVRPFGSSTEPGSEFFRKSREAAAVHRDIAAGWDGISVDRTPSVWPYFGRGHRTLSRAAVVNGRLQVTKQDPEWRPNAGWLGDGTVPALSAIPFELSNRPEQAQALPEKHGAMGSTPAVLEKLVTLQGDDLPVRGRNQPAKPWIGWDIDDAVPAGRETTVGAVLHHGDSGVDSGPGNSATLVVSGPGVTLPATMRPDAGGWRVGLPPLPVGLYRLDVEIKEGRHGTSVYGGTPLAVLDVPVDVELDPTVEEQTL